MKTSELINLLIKYSDSWKHDGTGCFGFDIRHDGLDEIAQLYSAREEVYVECGKNAQTHYVVSTKAETDMAYIPVRKLTPQQPSEEEIHKLVNKYLIIEESLCADDYPYFTMKGAKAIKELLNR